MLLSCVHPHASQRLLSCLHSHASQCLLKQRGHRQVCVLSSHPTAWLSPCPPFTSCTLCCLVRAVQAPRPGTSASPVCHAPSQAALSRVTAGARPQQLDLPRLHLGMLPWLLLQHGGCLSQAPEHSLPGVHLDRLLWLLLQYGSSLSHAPQHSLPGVC